MIKILINILKHISNLINSNNHIKFYINYKNIHKIKKIKKNFKISIERECHQKYINNFNLISNYNFNI